jgi:hypothetical protein
MKASPHSSTDSLVAMNEKRLRFDLLIAVSALLISTIAALASVYQTRVIREQLSATVWPYLSFDRTFSPQAVTLSLTNYGIGPALVRSASVELNGKQVPSWDEVIAEYARVAHQMNVKGVTRISDANLDGSVVLSAGVTRRLLEVQAAGATMHAVRRVAGGVALTVCYCSLLGQCWQATSGQMGAPQERASCPLGAAINAKTPTP